ncbi:MAG: class I SAM-dependent methyltransferase, partial [Candidatus Omnitrophica bacterium]|nr:class I SAM-dependent methyltransferase [Candidatus Omnitrophota bacterium]
MKSAIKNRQDLQAEIDLHNEEYCVDSGHWMSSPLLISRERQWLKYDVEKIRFYGYLARYIRNKHYKRNAKILIAPVGNGSDFKYLYGIYKEVHGIDISTVQISQCPKKIITKEGDILNSGYEDGSFDIIIVSFFLHHLHDAGLEPFMHEFYRLLRKDGTIAFLEPSSLYPLSWVLALVSKFVGEFPAKVKGERPV